MLEIVESMLNLRLLEVKGYRIPIDGLGVVQEGRRQVIRKIIQNALYLSNSSTVMPGSLAGVSLEDCKLPQKIVTLINLFLQVVLPPLRRYLLAQQGSLL